MSASIFLFTLKVRYHCFQSLKTCVFENVSHITNYWLKIDESRNCTCLMQYSVVIGRTVIVQRMDGQVLMCPLLSRLNLSGSVREIHSMALEVLG